jgi:hypothetical protein
LVLVIDAVFGGAAGPVFSGDSSTPALFKGVTNFAPVPLMGCIAATVAVGTTAVAEALDGGISESLIFLSSGWLSFFLSGFHFRMWEMSPSSAFSFAFFSELTAGD